MPPLRTAPLALLDGPSPTFIPPDHVVRRRGTDGLWRRFAAIGGALHVTHGEGPGARRERLGPGDVVRLGRRAALVVASAGSQRYPDAVVWRGFLARSPATLRGLIRLAGAASSAAPVWLRGESGTGKELAARALHDVSPRASGPFVALNCAALPDTLAEAELFGAVRGAYTGSVRDRLGAFAQADGGTLFLDEVAELPMQSQGKLLRVLETGELQPLGAEGSRRVDVRVVAATWRDLDQAVDAGHFRFDLLQRLGVLRVSLPALRQRPGDIGPLLEAAMEALDADDLWPAPPLLAALEAAPWPGNVRQLRSVAQRAAVWGDPRELLPAPRVLPRPSSGGLPARGRRRHNRRGGALGRDAVERAGGNRAAAARALGVSRSTLYRWLSGPSAVVTGRLDDPSPVDTL
jgi:DNA-binding NtrC family response regulator